MNLRYSRFSWSSMAAWPVLRAPVFAVLPSVVGCCALVALGAQVRVPVPGTEVPMTLQGLAVLLAGFALTPPRAVCAMLLYLACGAAGLPVFAAGSVGLAGSTGGYLLGFVLGAWLVSSLRGTDGAGYGRCLLAGTAGMAAILTLGLIWRAGLFYGDLELAAATGVTPFLAKAVVEVCIAAALAVALRAGKCAGDQGRVRMRTE